MDFYENYDNTIEVVFGGATGIGKTYMASIVMLFMVYRLSCYHNPQLEFFLAPGTSIVFSVQSASLNLAKKVAFDAVGGLCKQSNYFMQHFMYDKNVRTELRFPKGIYIFPLSGADTAALGLNLFGGCFPAEQEYLRSDGSYGVFGDCETDNILTSDGFSVFDAEAPSQSVCTHTLAEIIRLHFEDGSFIDCTPEQRFKNEQNEWVCADAAGGQALLFTSNLQGVKGTLLTIRCTRIERLKKHIPVFDKKEVQGTHACIVPIKTKEGSRSSKHLIAHNCLDELNFMQVVTNSARGGAAGLEGYDQAAGIYNTIITRIKGRFQDKGKIPGKLLLLSSANYPGDFISRKEDEFKESQARYEQTKDPKDRPTIHVIKMSQWESIPEDRFCGEKFLLEIGNENKTTRILRTMDDAVEESDVIEIPVEYISEFRKDPEKSLRDIAGIPVGGKNLFIPYRSKIEDAQLNFETLYPQGQLFLYDSLVMQEILHDMSRPDFSLLINKEHLQELLLDTATPFAVHIDLGITGDAAGLCISRITGYKLVPHTKIYDPSAGSFVEVRDERMPVYTIHGAMQIKHGGGEVDIDALTDFVIYLRQFLNIKYTTMDTFQSRTSLQRLKKHGIVVGTVSTDTDQEPYTELRSSLKDDRMLMPRHYVLAHELSTLQRGSDGKVDHPLGTGSKDVSDAAACSCFVLLRREANFATLSRKAVGGVRGSHRMSTGRHIKNNSVRKTGFGGIQSKLSKRRI